MTDSDTSPERLLASAALDNEVTTDERARVDTSPELASELAFYAELQGRIRDVAVPDAVRESALAAALEAFDTAHLGEDPAIGAEAAVVSLHERRKRQYRFVGGAAAAAVVAVVAIGIITRPDSGNDSSTAFKTDSSLQVAAPLPAAVGELGGDSADRSVDAPAAQVAPGEASATYPAEESTAAPAMAEGAAPPSPMSAVPDNLPSFTTRDEIVAFALSGFSSTVSPSTTVSPAATPSTVPPASDASSPAAETEAPLEIDCSLDRTLPYGLAIYNGAIVIVRTDDAAHAVIVTDISTCAVIDSIPIP